VEKAQAREEIARRLAGLSAECRREASECIRRLVAELPELRRARTVLMFLSIADEVDTFPIIADALAAGKAVAVPKVDRKRKAMDACRLRPEQVASGKCQVASGKCQVASEERGQEALGLSLATGHSPLATLDLAPGVFGILEPAGNETVEPGSIDFLLVPARGFDRQGNRLGRGGGYYDRYMSHPDFRATRCGVAYSAQVLDAIPHDAHDLPVHILVTESGVLRFGGP
jgi:5-formyltetrahydrofolate cyclo-ligase